MGNSLDTTINITPSTTEWTNQDVTIYATCSDDLSGIASLKYKLNDGVWQNYTDGAVVTENGTVYFRATDNAGNVTETSYVVNNIDKIVPTITDVTPSTTEWTNQDVTITANFADDASEIASFEYKIDDCGIWQNYTDGVVMSENGTVFFRATDNAGNVTETNYVVTNIDKTAPEIGTPCVFYDSGCGGIWDRATITVSVEDFQSGIEWQEYSTDGWDWRDAGSNYSNVTVYNNGTVYFRVTDKAGNVAETSCEVNSIVSEMTPPSISYNVVYDDSSPSLGRYRATVSMDAFDPSGIASMEYSWGDGWQSYCGSFDVYENGTVFFRATDNVGNVAETSCEVTGIDPYHPEFSSDTNPPSISVSEDIDPCTGAVRLHVSASDSDCYTYDESNSVGVCGSRDGCNWDICLDDLQVDFGNSYAFCSGYVNVFNNGVFYFRATDRSGNVAETSYEVTGIAGPSIDVSRDQGEEWTNQSIVLSVSASGYQGWSVSSLEYSINGETWSNYETAITLTENATVYFRATDYYGNMSETSYQVTNVDNVGPVIDVTPSTTEWTNQDVTIYATCSDDLSGIASLEYKLNDGEWQNYTDGAVMTENGTLYFKATDNVGNVTETSYVVNNIDKIAPGIDIVPSTADWTKEPVTLAASFSDANGVATMQYSFNGEDWMDYAQEISVETNGIVYFRATDNAGNETEASYSVSCIDNTAPTVGYNVSYNFDSYGRTSWAYIYVYATDDQSGVALQEYRCDCYNSGYGYGYGYNYGNYSSDWQFFTGCGDCISCFDNGTYYLRVTDYAGNMTETSLYVYDIYRDMYPPQITISDRYNYGDGSYSYGGYGNWAKSVELTVSAYDDSGVNYLEYSLGGNCYNYMDNGGTVTVTENTTVYFHATDVYGNYSETSYYVSNVDNDTPWINSCDVNYQSSCAVISVNSYDNTSGIARLEYSLDGGSTWCDAENTYQVTVYDDGVVDLRAIDYAGNVSETYSCMVSGIVDITGPEIFVTRDQYGWATQVELSVSTSDSSGVNSVEYSLDGENWLAYTTAIALTENATVYFRATDTLGNVTEKNYVVNNVDNAAPTVGAITPGTTEWTMEPVTLAADFTDGASGIATVQYKIGDGEWQTYKDNSAATITIVENSSFDQKSYYGTYTLATEGEYSGYYVHSSGKYRFSATPSSSAAICSSSYQSRIGNYPYASEILDSGTERDDFIFCTTSDITSAVKLGSKTGVSNWCDLVLESGTISMPVVSENTTVYFKATDNVGNVTETSYVVNNIDNAAPVIGNILLENYVVTAEFSDELSGIATKEYKINDGEWQNYANGVSISEDCMVYFRATDNVGNVATTSYEIAGIPRKTTYYSAAWADKSVGESVVYQGGTYTIGNTAFGNYAEAMEAGDAVLCDKYYSSIWANESAGAQVNVVLDGETATLTIGDNAFATLADARKADGVALTIIDTTATYSSRQNWSSTPATVLLDSTITGKTNGAIITIFNTLTSDPEHETTFTVGEGAYLESLGTMGNISGATFKDVEYQVTDGGVVDSLILLGYAGTATGAINAKIFNGGTVNTLMTSVTTATYNGDVAITVSGNSYVGTLRIQPNSNSTVTLADGKRFALRLENSTIGNVAWDSATARKFVVGEGASVTITVGGSGESVIGKFTSLPSSHIYTLVVKANEGATLSLGDGYSGVITIDNAGFEFASGETARTIVSGSLANCTYTLTDTVYNGYGIETTATGITFRYTGNTAIVNGDGSATSLTVAGGSYTGWGYAANDIASALNEKEIILVKDVAEIASSVAVGATQTLIAENVAFDQGLTNAGALTLAGSIKLGKSLTSTQAITVKSNTKLSLDLTNYASGAMLVDYDTMLSAGQGNLAISIDVAENQAYGDYVLASGAASFNKSVTITCGDASSLALNVGSHVALDHTRYSLRNDDGSLILTIGAGETGIVTTAGTTTEVTVGDRNYSGKAYVVSEVATAIADNEVAVMQNVDFVSGTLSVSKGKELVIDQTVLRDRNSGYKRLLANQQGSVVISASTITNNKSTVYGYGDDPRSLEGSCYCYGGAIQNSGSVSVDTSLVDGNAAIAYGGSDDYYSPGFSYGGAIYATDNLTLSGSTFSNNSVFARSADYYACDGINNGAYGGAVYATGVSAITDCAFTGNTATTDGVDCWGSDQYAVEGGAYGGAVYNTGNITVKRASFSGNYVHSGAARSDNYYSYCSSGNHCVDRSDGGAIYNTGVLTVADGVFNGNFAYGYNEVDGGAISSTGELTIASCTFCANTATGYDSDTTPVSRGGAIANRSGVMSITDSIFRGNIANCFEYVSYQTWQEVSGQGGAVYNGGTATICDSVFETVTDSVYSTGTLTLGGTIRTAANIYSANAITMEDGTKLILDLASYGSADNMTEMLSNYDTAFGNGDNWSLTVNVTGYQSFGSYRIAAGAADFDKAITVTIDDVAVGNVTLGHSIASQSASYRLSVSDGDLLLTLDEAMPICANYTVSPDDWTNDVVTIAANYTSASDLSSREYSLDGETWSTYAENVTMSANGTVYFRATDVNGMMSEVSSYTVDTIDKVAPTITGISLQNYVVTASFADDLSGIASQEYKINDGEWQTYTDDGVVVSTAGTIFLRATDNAGNSTLQSMTYSEALPENIFYGKNWLAGEAITLTWQGKEYSGTVGNGIFYNILADASAQAQELGLSVISMGSGAVTKPYSTNGIDVTLAGDVVYKRMVLGGELQAGSHDYAGSYTFGIASGTFCREVAAGDASNKFVTREGDITFNVSGGVFNGGVYGGNYYANQKTAIGSAGLNGDVNFTISGGSFAGRVYGGCGAMTEAISSRAVMEGDVYLTIDASTNAIAFGEHVVAGNRGYGLLVGSTNVTVTGNGANLTFADSSVLFGGCSGDYYKVSNGTRTAVTSVVDPEDLTSAGVRALVFDAFTGAFGAEIRMFSDISLENNTAVNFTDGNLDLKEIGAWNFDCTSCATNLTKNKFTGDTINVDTSNWSGDWTLITGDASALADLGSATSVTLGGNTAVWNGSAWCTDEYMLAVEDETELIISKLA